MMESKMLARVAMTCKTGGMMLIALRTGAVEDTMLPSSMDRHPGIPT